MKIISLWVTSVGKVIGETRTRGVEGQYKGGEAEAGAADLRDATTSSSM